MKQTVSMLTGLIAVVLLATGLIVLDNIDLNRRLVQFENELLEAHARLEETQKQVTKTKAERDALNQQMNEAVLASQAAHEHAEEQSRLCEQARFAFEELQMEYLDLSKACAALEAQIMERDAPKAQPAPLPAVRRTMRFVKN